MKVVVVVPTYNEADNIKKLIPVLEKEFEVIPHECEVLVVDDTSPDGTYRVVEDLQKKYSFLHLLVRSEKKGLGAAYVHGFKYAMKELNADVIVEFDADFQHNPEDIKRLLAEIDAGSDYVIGSRFVKGGSIPKEWEFYRKFLSWGGNLFSKFVLGIFNVNDFTSGFKAARVKGFVDKIDLDNVLSEGFAYKIDLLFKMYKAGAKIKEVPISFGVREEGKSKMESNNTLDSLKVVVSLRINESKSFFKFIVVGFTGLGTDTLIFNLLAITSLAPVIPILVPGLVDLTFTRLQIFSLVSGLIAMTVTYVLNNSWSFNHNKITSKKDTAKSLLVYYVSSAIPIVFRSWLIKMSVAKFGDEFFIYNGAFFIGVVVGLVWNFTVYSKIIWKDKK